MYIGPIGLFGLFPPLPLKFISCFGQLCKGGADIGIGPMIAFVFGEPGRVDANAFIQRVLFLKDL